MEGHFSEKEETPKHPLVRQLKEGSCTRGSTGPGRSRGPSPGGTLEDGGLNKTEEPSGWKTETLKVLIHQVINALFIIRRLSRVCHEGRVGRQIPTGLWVLVRPVTE